MYGYYLKDIPFITIAVVMYTLWLAGSIFNNDNDVQSKLVRLLDENETTAMSFAVITIALCIRKYRATSSKSEKYKVFQALRASMVALVLGLCAFLEFWVAPFFFTLALYFVEP